MSDLRKNIGFIFQRIQPDQQPWSARTLNRAKAGGYPKAQWPERVRELLALVGLENKIDSYPSSLSGDLKQRCPRARRQKPEIFV
ncbi:MAG: hypothetical protein ACLSGC_07920 [Bifidobacterium pseudocatenulatum]